MHRRVLRLDVSLVHRRGVEGPLDDEVCLGESLFHVALDVVDVLLDVCRNVIVLAVVLGAVLFVKNRSAVGEGLRSGHDGRKQFVLNLDQGQRLLGVVGGARRDASDGMALVENLLAGHQRLAQVFVLPVLREVGGRRHGTDSGVRLRLARVDGFDGSMRVRAAKYLSVEQPGRVLVGAVLGDAGHLVGPVVTDGTLPDGRVLHLGQDNIRLIGSGH